MLSQSSVERPFYQHASASLLAQMPAEPDEAKPKELVTGWPDLYVHLESRKKALYTWRLSWWNEMGQIARYLRPRHYHAFITANTYDRGARRDWNIVDCTGTLDGLTCAGGMMTGLTDPDRPWLQLGPGIPGMELDRAGRMWYDDVTERLRYVQAETNFYDSLALMYEDLVFFGNGVVIDYEDEDDIFTCANPVAGEYCLAGSGIDYANQSLYIEDRRTVSQIVEMFGIEQCPEEIKGFWRQKGAALETEFVVGRAIEPNYAIAGKDGGPVGQIPGGFTWREIYWLVGKANAGPLSATGFHEKPMAVAQWERISNNAYAWGPATNALGDVIQLQLESRQKAEALEKVIKPPMGADAALKNEPASIKPGMITYYDTSSGKKGFHPLFEVRPDLAAITADITAVQERIGRAFYSNLFRMIEELGQRRSDITATEIDALREERLMQLGPVIGRIYKEGLRPRIRRQLGIMARRGMLPRKPPSLAKVPTKIDFVSMLTLAQRATSVGRIKGVFAFAQEIQPVFPDAPMALDAVEAVREYADLTSLPSRITRSPQEIQKMKDQSARQAAAQNAAGLAAAGVQGAQTLSKTPLGGGTALSALMGQPAGSA